MILWVLIVDFSLNLSNLRVCLLYHANDFLQVWFKFSVRVLFLRCAFVNVFLKLIKSAEQSFVALLNNLLSVTLQDVDCAIPWPKLTRLVLNFDLVEQVSPLRPLPFIQLLFLAGILWIFGLFRSIRWSSSKSPLEEFDNWLVVKFLFASHSAVFVV